MPLRLEASHIGVVTSFDNVDDGLQPWRYDEQSCVSSKALALISVTARLLEEYSIRYTGLALILLSDRALEREQFGKLAAAYELLNDPGSAQD